jgi:hypothetical protein
VTLTAPSLVAPGKTVEGKLSFTNGTPLPVRDVTFAVEGFRAEVSGGVRSVNPGQTVTVPVKLTPDAALKPEDYKLTATATYRARLSDHRVTDSATVTVPYASLAAAYGNVGVTDAAHVTAGNIDGGGSSFRADGLADAGLRPGATFTASGAQLIWPAQGNGSVDNVVGGGQTIAVSGSGSRLVLAGTGTGTAKGTVTVWYADGSTSQGDTGFPNWCCADPTQYGASTVATVMGKNTQSGAAYPTVPYKIFSNTIPVTAGKQVVAITLPANAALHVFAAGIA